MIKSFFHWKVFVNLLLAIAIFFGLVWLTFRWLEVHTNHGNEIAVPNVMNKSIQDAIKTLEDSGLEYEVDSFKFEPKFRPLQVLKIYPSPGSHVKSGRSILIIVNPKTWAPVSVPDVIDRYKGLAFRQLEQVGLKIGDTIFEPSIQRDAVLRMVYKGTSVKPGTLLPRFSTVDLVIGAGPERNIAVPNLVGLTVQEAKKVITANLFEFGLVDHEDGGKEDSDIVYYQDPSSSDLRDQGMQIDLWASKKTPAEMGAKISELNAIYRVKIDTTLPPIRYDEVPAYEEPKKYSEPVETPKNIDQRPKEKPKTSSTNTPEKPATKPTNSETPISEKPKAKKVVVE